MKTICDILTRRLVFNLKSEIRAGTDYKFCVCFMCLWGRGGGVKNKA